MKKDKILSPHFERENKNTHPLKTNALLRFGNDNRLFRSIHRANKSLLFRSIVCFKNPQTLFIVVVEVEDDDERNNKTTTKTK